MSLSNTSTIPSPLNQCSLQEYSLQKQEPVPSIRDLSLVGGNDISHCIIPKTLHESVVVKGTTGKNVHLVTQQNSKGISVILDAAALILETSKEQKN